MIYLLFLFNFVLSEFIPGDGFRCGKLFSGDLCPNSECCSTWGYCGITIDYCGANCQSNCLIYPTTTSLSLPTTTITTTPSASPPIPQIKESCGANKIALTFDDGISEYTNDLLSYLSVNNIKATFFVIGENAKKYPEVLKRMALLGFEIAVHSLTHPDFTTLTDTQMRYEIAQTVSIIKKLTKKTPRRFRFPYLAFNENALRIVAEFNLEIIGVSLDTNDWRYYDTNPELIYTAFSQMQKNKGYISLQHDRLNKSLELLPRIVKYIRDRNFKFVTLNNC